MAAFWMLLVAIFHSHGTTAYPEYLGCFDDRSYDPDVAGILMTYEALDVLDCVARCRVDGYPYAGVQNGRSCFCGNSYGRYGNVADCTLICNGNVCGGSKASDVFYTAETGQDTFNSRAFVVHNRSTTFWEARQECIKEGGDLAPITNPNDRQQIVDLAKSKDLRSGVWFGLWQRPEKTKFLYEWTNVETEAFNYTAFESYWGDSRGDEDSQHCTILGLSDSKWHTANCSEYRPFVCWQERLPVSTDGDGNATQTATDDGAPSMLSFYIVMPFFFLCYGGSCLIYCVHSVYRQCRRLQHRHTAVGCTTDKGSGDIFSEKASIEWTAPPLYHRGSYHSDAPELPGSVFSRDHHATRKEPRKQEDQARLLIVTTTDENIAEHSQQVGDDPSRWRMRTRTETAESLDDIRIREEDTPSSSQRSTGVGTGRKARRQNALGSRLLPIDDVLLLKKTHFGKDRLKSNKILDT